MGSESVAEWPVSTRWARAMSDQGMSWFEGQIPLAPSSCWALHGSTAHAANTWSATAIQLVHEQSLSPDWEARLALGADREAWPELGRVAWQPVSTVAIHLRSAELTAGAWCSWRLTRPLRPPQIALHAQGSWGDWSAAASFRSDSSFHAWVERAIHESWTLGVGWRAPAFAFTIGLLVIHSRTPRIL